MGESLSFATLDRKTALDGHGPWGKYDHNIGEWPEEETRPVLNFGDFDREYYISTFLGKYDDAYGKEIEDALTEEAKENCRLISAAQIDRALSEIKRIDDTVRSMPFSYYKEDGRGHWPWIDHDTKEWHDEENHKDNIEIAKFLNVELGNYFYHYCFPWYQKRGSFDTGFGCLVEVLRVVKASIEEGNIGFLCWC